MRTSFDGHPLEFVNSRFEVDKEIYPLLKVLWSKGFKTEYSCQGGERVNDTVALAYILFYGDVHAKWFTKLIEDSGYECSYSPREYSYGGGASVNFSPDLIEKITNLVSSAGNCENASFHEEVRAAAGYKPKKIITYDRECKSFEYRLK